MGRHPGSARRGADQRRDAIAPARSLPLAGKLGLLAGSLLLTLACLEIGLRLYYGSAGVPTVVTYGSTSEGWKQRWIERHLNNGVEVYYGFDRYNPLFGWSTKPNLRDFQVEGLPPITTNSDGWRALHGYTHDRHPGVTRIVALGDSFTFGEQARDEDVWTAQLERRLDATEVLNLGVHGYGTDQQLRVLEEQGLAYHPDVVVLGFFVEDILRNGLAFRDYAKPMFVLRDGALVLTNSPVPPPDQILAGATDTRPWSDLVAFAQSGLNALGPRHLDDVVDEENLLRLTKAILARMQKETAAAGAKLLVVTIPSRREMPRVEAALGDWAPQVGYGVVNVGPALDAAEKSFGQATFGNFYHSTFGDFVMAAAVGQALVDHGWVPAPSPGAVARNEQRLRELTAHPAR